MLNATEPELRLAWRLGVLNRIHAGVSHDIKSPINAMVLNLELLKRSVTGDLPGGEELRAKQQRWLGVVEQELGRLRRALEVILAATAPPDEVDQRFNLQDVLDEVESMLQPQARQQKIELAVGRAEAPVHVRARRDETRLAVLSLAVRALEAVAPQDRLRLDVRADGAAARIVVADNGAPLTPEDRALLAGSPPVAGEARGPLAAAMAIATDLGGRVDVAAGDGTVLELILPLEASRS